MFKVQSLSWSWEGSYWEPTWEGFKWVDVERPTVETEEEAYKLIDTLPPAKNEYHSFAKAYRVVKA